MEELKDIKDIVEVHEYSFMLLIGVTLTVLCLVGVALYLFKNRRRRRKKPTQRQLALSKLTNLDYSNTKEVVYTFEEKSQLFLSEKNQKTFNSLIRELEIYKYKKEIPPLDEKIKEKIETFIKGLK
jgi:hypothetical protein